LVSNIEISAAKDLIFSAAFCIYRVPRRNCFE